MAFLPKLPPSSLRPDVSLGSGVIKTRSPEPRPYLISASFRRTENLSSRSSFESRTITLFPHESEDARLTGSTRSLFRRLLALNLPAGTTESLTARSSAATVFIKTA
jgi:hypothetical protein